MARIHGIAYMVIGAGVAFGSWAVNFENLKLFFYIGCVFVIIGLFKVAFKGAGENEDKKITKYHEAHSPKVQHNTAQSKVQNQNFKRCPRCYSAMSLRANFCSVCGTKI